MKKIINKIKEILEFDISHILYNIWTFIGYDIIYMTYDRTCNIIRKLIDFVNLSSYGKTKIFILAYIVCYSPLMDYTATIANGGGRGFDMDYRYFSLREVEGSNIKIKDTMAKNIIKIKYDYKDLNLENCKSDYEKTLKKIKSEHNTLLISTKECSIKNNNKNYSYQIIGEAPIIYKLMYKVESIIKTIPYSFLAILLLIGTAIAYPFMMLTDT